VSGHVVAGFRVVVDLHMTPAGSARFEALWPTIADEVAAVDGCLGQWLLRPDSGRGAVVIMSDWVDEEAFRRFERGPVHAGHRDLIGPMRIGGGFRALRVVGHRPGTVPR
jgi:heme-degrading monooxygenase HmoA